jgi:hypothetical protein
MGFGNDGRWGLRERLRGCLAMDSIFCSSFKLKP